MIVAGVLLALITSYRVAGIVVALLGAAWAEIMGHLHLAPTLAYWIRTRGGRAG